MLRLRLLSALFFIPALVTAGWIGEPWVSIVVAGFVVLALRELFDLAERGGYAPLKLLGHLIGVAFVAVAYLRTATGLDLSASALAWAVMALVVLRMARPQGITNFADWAVTLAGATYIGLLLSHWVLLRDLPAGREWSILTLLGTFASDSSAYFVGRAFGKHQLAPTISPKKSWEGAAGALVLTPLAVVGLVAVLGLPVTPLAAAGLGLALSIAAQFGDLAESALKRSAHVKDAGDTIPGHGGVLDRTDSLTFAGAVVYYLVTWVGMG